ncbi:hypothetical protein QFC19_007622 [Naganishia cerealis]|uniref:Uncharacterized protein n=1 Tax=Naganishia cerealis TaxID=610337 RepID=A0ACC2V7P3_9TREE|nr:hypothetical protein QFC19_007622 [Naganishia cerealis]
MSEIHRSVSQRAEKAQFDSLLDVKENVQVERVGPQDSFVEEAERMSRYAGPKRYQLSTVRDISTGADNTYSD